MPLDDDKYLTFFCVAVTSVFVLIGLFVAIPSGITDYYRGKEQCNEHAKANNVSAEYYFMKGLDKLERDKWKHAQWPPRFYVCVVNGRRIKMP